MLQQMTRNWWVVVLRGVLAVVFGLAAILWPALTLLTLIQLFGAFALVEGVFAVVGALFGREHNGSWWMHILEGIVAILVGLGAWLLPGLTAFTILNLIAAWAIVNGVFRIVMAIRLRREIEGEWMLIASGILTALFGVAIVLFPLGGALAIAWLIGVQAIMFGLLLLGLGFRLRGMNKRVQQVSAT